MCDISAQLNMIYQKIENILQLHGSQTHGVGLTFHQHNAVGSTLPQQTQDVESLLA